MIRRSRIYFLGSAAFSVLAVGLRFAGIDTKLRDELLDAAMAAAGTGEHEAPLLQTAELLLLDEHGRVLRGPQTLQGTVLDFRAVRDMPFAGSDVSIELWPDGGRFLTAFAATRRSTGSNLRIAVVRHPPDRGPVLRSAPFVAGSFGALFLLAGLLQRRREQRARDEEMLRHAIVTHGPADNVVRLEPRAPRSLFPSPLTNGDEQPPLLLDEIVVEPAPMQDAVTAAIARMPFDSMPFDDMPTDIDGAARKVVPGAGTPLFNDAPLLALQASLTPHAFGCVLQARLADAARQVRILEVTATGDDALTLQREAADLCEFAAACGGHALREAVSVVMQVAELQLAAAYPSAVAQVAALFAQTEAAIVARFPEARDEAVS